MLAFDLEILSILIYTVIYKLRASSQRSTKRHPQLFSMKCLKNNNSSEYRRIFLISTLLRSTFIKFFYELIYGCLKLFFSQKST